MGYGAGAGAYREPTEREKLAADVHGTKAWADEAAEKAEKARKCLEAYDTANPDTTEVGQ